MTEQDDFADLLPDELQPPAPNSKGTAVPLVRTPKQKAVEARALAAQEASDLRVQADAAKAQAARLAQIVNLHIGGFSLAEIGASIGASEAEVDRLLTKETARYVKNQPALRVYVRNYLSGKYNDLLEAVWDEATDKTHKEKLEHQDRALRILKEMKDLHGAAAPTQTEIKVESSPEAIDHLVSRLAASQGLGYDTTIFDVVPGEVVHDAATASHAALAVSGNAVEQPQPEDGEGL